MTDLAIVIVSYQAREHLERCLASLGAAPPQRSHEIVVVDNASSDGSADRVAAEWPSVTLIRLPDNRGFAAATNVGIRRTRSEFVLLLNSDAIVPSGALDRLVAALERHADAAAIGPRLVDDTGQVELSFGRMFSPLNELRQKLLVRASRSGIPGARAYVQRLVSRPRTPDWISGACLLVRRADADRAGLLDERFFLYAEDVDFCARLRALGRLIRFAPEIDVVHARGQSVAFDPRAAEAHYRRSQLAFYAKHAPRWLPWLRLYLALRGRLPPSRDSGVGIRDS
ncbi:MAG: glycosyltransferase family 2 protein [Acidobacteria bacterium]|nr:glycosyltransferase family 2 protein [Acidobacteriota bacterium]